MSSTTAHQNFRNSFKASSLLGASFLINVLIGMIRTRIIAMLLGPVGVGLVGMYNSIINTFSAVAGMGLSDSGVRQIAEASADMDKNRQMKVVSTVKQAAWISGTLGSLIMFFCAGQLSLWTFGNHDHTIPLRFLSILILLGNFTQGQICLLRGFRNVKAIAKINIFSSVFSTLIAIPCYYFWGMKGIVPSLILCASMNLITGFFFVQKMKIATVRGRLKEQYQEFMFLFKLGFCFMISGVVFLLSCYVVNVIINQKAGLEELGLYQAAFTLTSMLFGFIFNAMGTDFYPQLTTLLSDRAAMRETVNRQCEICLLLSMPLVVGLLFFSSSVIHIFYTGKFLGAVSTIQLLAISCYIQMISFPVGYVMLAKGMGKFIIIKSIVNAIILTGMCYLLVNGNGKDGAAIAYLLMYVVNTFVNLVAAYLVSGVYWTRYILFLTGTTMLIVLVSYSCTNWIADDLYRFITGFLILSAVCMSSLWILMRRLNLSKEDILKFPIRRFCGKS